MVNEAAPKNILFEIKIPRTSEKTPEAASQFFASLSILPKKKVFDLFKPNTCLSLEIVVIRQEIHFIVAVPADLAPHVESQLSAQYPEAVFFKLPKDYLSTFLAGGNPAYGQVVLGAPYYLPLRTYKDFKDVDTLASLLGTMSKAGPNDFMLVQILVANAGNWQSYGRSLLEKGIQVDATQSKAHPYAKQIQEKILTAGFLAGIRLVATNPQILANLAGAFGTFASDVNFFKLIKPPVFQDKQFKTSIVDRTFSFVPRSQVLNVGELASIWHPPVKLLSGIKNISWGTTLTGEPPPNLPVAEGLTEEEKKEINFIARTEYKNRIVTFGIKKKDRRRHTYIIGKSGVGKSWLIANMAINDIRNGDGVAVIDPHGDTIEHILDYIPSYRINDVCLLDPSDVENPFHLNALEIKKEAYEPRSQKDLVASGIVAIFAKLYGHSWGPRLEYILRNTLLTLTDVPNSTFLDVTRILTDRIFRKKCIEQCQDSVLVDFWRNEFERMDPKQISEAISPILNKVGQFTSSRIIRQIIGSPHSTIDIEDIMNEGKIMLLNLPQGKMGEDNAALLGAMFITKIQLAAMNRAHLEEEKRKDFFVYVDEFQNFATSSFVKILAEARKYRLNLTMANQYIAQLQSVDFKTDLSKAIFGNVGTLISFIVGADDAKVLAEQFGQTYTLEQLVSLGKYQIVIKLCIDSLTSMPFYAVTLPLPRCINQNREKVIRVSREKYNRKPISYEAKREPVTEEKNEKPPVQT